MNCPLNCPHLVIGALWHFRCRKYKLDLGGGMPLSMKIGRLVRYDLKDMDRYMDELPRRALK